MDRFEPDAHFLANTHSFVRTHSQQKLSHTHTITNVLCDVCVVHLYFIWFPFSSLCSASFEWRCSFVRLVLLPKNLLDYKFSSFFFSPKYVKRPLLLLLLLLLPGYHTIHTISSAVWIRAHIYPPNHDNVWVLLYVCDCCVGLPHIALSCLNGGPMYWCVSMKTYPFFWLKYMRASTGVCVSLCVCVCMRWFVWIWTLLEKRRECVVVYDRKSASHHRVVSTVNFSLEKGFFIAIARQLSPAKRHAHQTALFVSHSFLRFYSCYIECVLWNKFVFVKS